MKSGGSVIGALMVLLLTLTGGCGFFYYALKLSNTSIANTFDLNFDPTGLLLKIAALFFVVILSHIAAIMVARAKTKPVYAFFSDRWLPKTELYTTEPGERLEFVVPQSFPATTVWELATRTFPATFGLSFCMGLILLGAGELLRKPGLFWGSIVVIFINMLLIPWSYWIKDWSRRYTKFVAFTTVTFYIRVRTPIFALLTGLGNLPKVSKTPIDQLQEIQSSADPEDFDPNFKTGWVRDQYTAWLAKRFGTRTLFLRSRSNLAEDTLFWVDNGPGVVKILNRLIKGVQEHSKARDYVEQNVGRILAGDADSKTWRQRNAKAKAARYLNELNQRPDITEPKTYDLFRVEDPGLYDSAGNEVEAVQIPLDIDVSAQEETSLNLDEGSSVNEGTNGVSEDYDKKLFELR